MTPRRLPDEDPWSQPGCGSLNQTCSWGPHLCIPHGHSSPLAQSQDHAEPCALPAWLSKSQGWGF